MSERFYTEITKLAGLTVLHRKPIIDERGWFERMFCTQELQNFLGDKSIKQVNRSFTEKQGTVRGMHYQKAPKAEKKFIYCLRGEVFDVAVDLRESSSTFLHWHSEVLSANNSKVFVIPEGFAHGFQTLSDECELIYLHTEFYCSEIESGLSHQDPMLDINWPLPVVNLSERDANFPWVTKNFQGVIV